MDGVIPLLRLTKPRSWAGKISKTEKFTWTTDVHVDFVKSAREKDGDIEKGRGEKGTRATADGRRLPGPKPEVQSCEHAWSAAPGDIWGRFADAEGLRCRRFGGGSGISAISIDSHKRDARATTFMGKRRG